MSSKEKSYYIHEYTLKVKIKPIKINPWFSLKDEIQIIEITDKDILQLQMIEIKL